MDANKSTTEPAIENCYLSENLEYYLAAKPTRPGDSRIPYPTAMLVAAIRNSESGFTTADELTNLTHSYGNSKPETVPTFEEFAGKEPETTEVVQEAPEPQLQLPLSAQAVPQTVPATGVVDLAVPIEPVEATESSETAKATEAPAAEKSDTSESSKSEESEHT